MIVTIEWWTKLRFPVLKGNTTISHYSPERNPKLPNAKCINCSYRFTSSRRQKQRCQRNTRGNEWKISGCSSLIWHRWAHCALSETCHQHTSQRISKRKCRRPASAPALRCRVRTQQRPQYVTFWFDAISTAVVLTDPGPVVRRGQRRWGRPEMLVHRQTGVRDGRFLRCRRARICGFLVWWNGEHKIGYIGKCTAHTSRHMLKSFSFSRSYM